MRKLMKVPAIFGIFCMMTWAGAPAQADSYPNKPLKMVVPYAPGGASDIMGRIVANELTKALGQPVVVENKPGVGGMLGLSGVAKSTPDGYTIGIAASGPMVSGIHLQDNPLYDPLTDFAPIGLIARAQMLLLAAPNLKDATIAGIIEQAKKEPGQLMLASGAQAYEMAFALLQSKADVSIELVKYVSDVQASVDVMAGRVPLMLTSIGALLEQVKAGKLKPVAVLGENRSPALPDVPTVGEAVPGYEASGWIGMVAPLGTPKSIVAELNAQLQKIVASPSVNKELVSLGYEPTLTKPEEYASIIRTEHAKWGEVTSQLQQSK